MMIMFIYSSACNNLTPVLMTYKVFKISKMQNVVIAHYDFAHFSYIILFGYFSCS